jgi:ferredoxin-NADP reductase
VRPTPSCASGVHAVIINATAVIINGAMVFLILRMPCSPCPAGEFDDPRRNRDRRDGIVAGSAATGVAVQSVAMAIGWQSAELVEVRAETDRASTFRLALSDPVRHLPGQHYVLRLTAPDGYTASRSYSVASAPDDSGCIELTVERLADGEVSTFLHDEARPGDRFELRGPIGGWFVWHGDTPALLIGGGSGVVPLMAMLRHARNVGRSELLRLVVSVRRPEDLLYRDEILGPATIVLTTRAPWPGSDRTVGRLGPEDLPAVPDGTTVYVCGSSGFADAATAVLIAGGVDPAVIRVERFGATG